MRTDIATITGAHHLASAQGCQDYCLAGVKEGYAWAAVADGCSTGGLTDLGARALVLAARDMFCANAPELIGARWFQELLLATLPSYTAALTQADCLATVGTLQATGKHLLASLFGDGAVVLRHCDGSISLYNLQYTDNAPLYPAYLLDQDAIARYADQFGSQERVVTFTKLAADGAMEKLNVTSAPALTEPWQLEVDIEQEEVELALVCTDGLGTCDTGLYAAARAVAGVKNPAGEFLRRRLGRLARDWQKTGQMPIDDLAVAGIWLLPEVDNV